MVLEPYNDVQKGALEPSVETVKVNKKLNTCWRAVQKCVPPGGLQIGSVYRNLLMVRSKKRPLFLTNFAKKSKKSKPFLCKKWVLACAGRRRLAVVELLRVYGADE